MTSYNQFRKEIIASVMVLLVAIFSISIVSAWDASSSINNGLVSYWSFNSTSGGKVLDEINHNDLNLNTLTLTTGKLSQGLQCDGTNYAINDSFSAIPMGNYNRTLAFWFKPPAAARTGELVAYGTTTSIRQTFGIINELDANQNNITKISTYGDDNYIYNYTNSEWQFIVAIYNATSSNGTIMVYVNGTKILDKKLNGILNTAGNQITFCAESWGGAYLYTGIIDEVGIWNRTLTESEISKMFNSGYGSMRGQKDGPNLTITEPNKTYTSKTAIPINITALSLIPISYCWFNVTRGASLEVANTQIVNCANMTFDVSADAYYVLHACVNDTGSNENCSSASFTISTTAPPIPPGPGGGGGGATIIEQIINPIKESICDKNLPKFDVAWETFVLDKSFANFKIVWLAYWDYSLCKQAASIIPFD